MGISIRQSVLAKQRLHYCQTQRKNRQWFQHKGKGPCGTAPKSNVTIACLITCQSRPISRKRQPQGVALFSWYNGLTWWALIGITNYYAVFNCTHCYYRFAIHGTTTSDRTQGDTITGTTAKLQWDRGSDIVSYYRQDNCC